MLCHFTSVFLKYHKLHGQELFYVRCILLPFAKAAEAISSRQKIKVQNGGEERRKIQKISKDNKVLRTKD